jgi:hypothetical protein
MLRGSGHEGGESMIMGRSVDCAGNGDKYEVHVRTSCGSHLRFRKRRNGSGDVEMADGTNTNSCTPILLHT